MSSSRETRLAIARSSSSVCGMNYRRWLLAIAVSFFGAQFCLHAADTSEEVERTVAEIIKRPAVTVVHFWAPWCGNCKREMEPDGWAKFVEANPDVRVVFVNVWHRDQDPAPKLAAAGLGAQKNFIALTHPNASTKREDQLQRFLGLPMQWVPTTWVFRDGKLRYALNYGEVRFEMLQQMVEDAARKW